MQKIDHPTGHDPVRLVNRSALFLLLPPLAVYAKLRWIAGRNGKVRSRERRINNRPLSARRTRRRIQEGEKLALHDCVFVCLTSEHIPRSWSLRDAAAGHETLGGKMLSVNGLSARLFR